jgi:Cu2+-exporting ATPase
LRGNDPGHCIAIAAALEQGARHPAAQALMRAAANSGYPQAVGIAEPRDIAGEGVEATIHGRRIRVGRVEFVAAIANGSSPPELQGIDPSALALALGDEDGWIALFTLADRLRPEAARVIDELRRSGCQVWLLSGDRAPVAEQVGRALAVDGVTAEARPEDKLAFVRKLQQRGAVVAMVGDGVNDAPVLAQAQVSIALDSGSYLAQSSADLVLAEHGLAGLGEAVAVARKAQRIIRQNFLWALLYNAIAIPAAALGQVTPLVASVGMAASSALVVANALRAAHPALWGSNRRAATTRERLMPASSVYAVRTH